MPAPLTLRDLRVDEEFLDRRGRVTRITAKVGPYWVVGKSLGDALNRANIMALEDRPALAA